MPIPAMFDWTKCLELGNNYFYNTPSMLAVWLSGQMCDYMIKKGGIEYYEGLAERRAEIIYSVIN